jgi:5-methylcytosine-specific restriction endonuclease McrA
MKLPNFYQSNLLNQTRDKIRAPLKEIFTEINWDVRLSNSIIAEIKQLETVGIVTGDWGEFAKPDKEGVLRARDGKKVVVYIPEYGKKYHVTECGTLKRMQSWGRYDRYIVSRRSDGMFKIDIGSNWERDTQLYVCGYCLNSTRYGRDLMRQNQNNLQVSIKHFDVVKWLALENENPILKKPKFDEFNTPKHNYTSDFDKISAQVRQTALYHCTKCKIDLSALHKRKYLHTHHKNGIKGDNSLTNLIPLCIKCHATEPSHQYMKASPDYKEFMEMYANA